MVNAWQLLQKDHMLCFGHTMNLAVKKGLGTDGIKLLLAKCRRLIGYFNHSYQKKPVQLGLKQKTLKLDVETRWNSIFDMIESVFNTDEAVTAMFRANPKNSHLLLTPEELTTLKLIQEVLLPWKKLTVLHSAETYPTLSFVLPSKQKLSTSLEVNFTDPMFIQDMKGEMVADLSSRYQGENLKMLLLCASFLDPRFRTLDFIVCSVEQKSDADKQKEVECEKKRVKAEIKERLMALDRKPQVCAIKSEPYDAHWADEMDTPTLPSLNEDDKSESAESHPPSKKPKVVDNFFDDFFSDIIVTKVEPAATALDKAKKELKLSLTLSVNGAISNC